MDLNTNLALFSYADAKRTAPPVTASTATFGNAIDDFSDMVANAETQALSAMEGKGDAHDLVQSLAQTELAIETVVTIRNKVVEAYQEILRMPV